MRYDISKEFNTPHFKNLLQQYEQSLADGTTPYWGSDDLLLLAEYYVSTGNFSQGDQVIDYAMSLHPDNSEIQLYKCGNLVALNQWEEAEKLLNQQSDPNDREALLLKAQLYIHQSLPEKANQLFDQVYQQEQMIETILDIVDVCLDSYQYDMAKEWIEVAYAEAPHHPDVLESMVDYLYSSGQSTLLPPYLNELIDLYPYNVSYWEKLAQAYLDREEMDKANEAIEFALTIDDKDPLAYHIKGAMFLMMEDIDSAVITFQQMERLSDEKLIPYLALMQCYYSLNDLEKCVEYCQKLLKMADLSDIDKANVYQKLANYYLKMGQPERARDYLSNALQLDESNYQIHLSWAELMFQAGNRHEACIYIQKGLEWAHNSDYETDALEIAAYLFLDAQLWKEALELFIRMEEMDPEYNKNNLPSMALCSYLTAGMNETTSQYLKRAVEDVPVKLEKILTSRLYDLAPDFYLEVNALLRARKKEE